MPLKRSVGKFKEPFISSSIPAVQSQGPIFMKLGILWFLAYPKTYIFRPLSSSLLCQTFLKTCQNMPCPHHIILKIHNTKLSQTKRQTLSSQNQNNKVESESDGVLFIYQFVTEQSRDSYYLSQPPTLVDSKGAEFIHPKIIFVYDRSVPQYFSTTTL